MLTLLITALLIGNVFVTALRLIDMQPLKAVKGFMHFSRLLGMIIAALDFGNIISIVKTKGKSKWSIGFCVNHILFMVTLLNLGIFAE